MSLLEQLNPQQREAVEYCEGPLLVIAGAGSGKTRVITYKIAYLIKELNIAPRRIFAATFTNKAAGEMRHRVTSLLGLPYDTPMNIATFHSLSAKILRREAKKIGISPNFVICDEKDQIALIKACLKELGISEKIMPPANVQQLINQIKMRMLNPDEIVENTSQSGQAELFLKIYHYYNRRLRDNDALDFEDLITELVRLLREDENTRTYYQQLFSYVLVDEFQDTNYSQYELIKQLVSGHNRVTVVGDEDQSIYSWRGAELDNLLHFADDFPDVKIVKLEQNYRSTGNILQAASTLIANNTKRLGKWLWTDKEPGEPLYLIQGADEIDEAKRVVKQIVRLHLQEGIPLRDIAIFFRQSSLSRVFEDQLRREGLPYRVVGAIRFYDRAEIKDLISYLRVVANPHNTLSLQRIINRPSRGIGEKTVNTLMQWATQHQVSLYEAMVSALDNHLLPERATSKIADLLAMLHRWQRLTESAKPDRLLKQIIEDTGYIEWLGDNTKLEVIGKIENIEQLISAVQEFMEEHPEATLDEYLEAVSLSTYVDEIRDDDLVSLMTIHCAKGLEFRVVFLVGLDEPIFPSHRTLEETGDIEEERRLFYVGLTRCKELLFLSRANIRRIFGRKTLVLPSRFLRELPEELLVSYMDRIFA